MIKSYAVMCEVIVDGKRVLAEQVLTREGHDKGEAERKALNTIRESVSIQCTAYTRPQWERKYGKRETT